MSAKSVKLRNTHPAAMQPAPAASSTATHKQARANGKTGELEQAVENIAPMQKSVQGVTLNVNPDMRKSTMLGLRGILDETFRTRWNARTDITLRRQTIMYLLAELLKGYCVTLIMLKVLANAMMDLFQTSVMGFVVTLLVTFVPFLSRAYSDLWLNAQFIQLDRMGGHLTSMGSVFWACVLAVGGFGASIGGSVLGAMTAQVDLNQAPGVAGTDKLDVFDRLGPSTGPTTWSIFTIGLITSLQGMYLVHAYRLKHRQSSQNAAAAIRGIPTHYDPHPVLIKESVIRRVFKGDLHAWSLAEDEDVLTRVMYSLYVSLGIYMCFKESGYLMNISTSFGFNMYHQKWDNFWCLFLGTFAGYFFTGMYAKLTNTEAIWPSIVFDFFNKLANEDAKAFITETKSGKYEKNLSKAMSKLKKPKSARGDGEHGSDDDEEEDESRDYTSSEEEDEDSE